MAKNLYRQTSSIQISIPLTRIYIPPTPLSSEIVANIHQTYRMCHLLKSPTILIHFSRFSVPS